MTGVRAVVGELVGAPVGPGVGLLEWRPEDGAHETEAVKWRHATEACSPGPPQAMPLGLIGSYGHHLRRPAAKKRRKGREGQSAKAHKT